MAGGDRVFVKRHGGGGAVCKRMSTRMYKGAGVAVVAFQEGPTGDARAACLCVSGRRQA